MLAPVVLKRLPRIAAFLMVLFWDLYFLLHINDITTYSDNTWVYMAMHGNTWQYMGIFGYTWLYMAIHGYTWQYMALHGYTWLYMAIHGNTW